MSWNKPGELGGLNQLGELKLKSSTELGALDISVPVRSPLCQRIHLPNRAVYGILGSWREGKIVPEKGSRPEYACRLHTHI